MRIWSINTCGLLACLLSLPCAAQQQVPAPEETAPPVWTAPAQPGERSPAPSAASFDAGQGTGGMFAAPLAEEKLSRMRGGDTRVSEMQLNGTVTGNSTIDVASGNNTIASGSFSNMNGLPMVVQNSGSNVLIQNATIVNVQFQP